MGPARVANAGADTGVNSIISLLLAAEARAFVLTMSSNWGRLLNEVREAHLAHAVATLL